MPFIQSTWSSCIAASAGSACTTRRDHSRRARSAGIAQTNQSASIRRRRPRRLRARAATIRLRRTSSASTVWPSWKRTPSVRRWATHGSIHASFVGALSTRSGAPSLPRCMMFMTKASAMLPIVRVLATVSLAATSERVRPRAMTFLYSADWLSARTKSHHEVCSHWP